VLFNVLGMLLDAAKGIASVQDVMTGDAKAQTMQPTTLLALIEQGMKVYTSIVKRIFRSQSQEFALLYAMNREFPDEDAYARVIDWEAPQAIVALMTQYQQAVAEAQAQGAEPPTPPPPQMLEHLRRPTMVGDYEDENCDVVPVADPSTVTDMQRMAKAQLVRELATEGQDVIDRGAAYRRVLMAAGIEDADGLMKQQAAPDPLIVEGAKAEIERKRAGAMKDLALADKAAMETEGSKQAIAMEHARIASGAMDDDAALESESKRMAANKTRLEMQLSQRQQEQAEREAEAYATGEAG
jgi:hypothetical protein